MRSTTAKPVRK